MNKGMNQAAVRYQYKRRNNSEIPKFFKKQQDAIEYSKSFEDHRVWAYEYERGLRTFMSCNVNVFWSIYQDVVKKHHYEVLIQGLSTKLYFDLEYYKVFNGGKDGGQLTNVLIGLVKKKLQEKYSFCSREENVVILDSSNAEKYRLF